MGFLYHCYTPGRYYWEVIASMQTIILVVISTFSFILGPFHAVMLLQVCFGGFLAMQYMFQPFAFHEVQRMQLASGICLLLTAIIGLSTFDVGAVAVPDLYKVIIGVIGFMSNVAFMCWCAWMTVTVDKSMWTDWVKPARTWLVQKWLRCVGVRST